MGQLAKTDYAKKKKKSRAKTQNKLIKDFHQSVLIKSLFVFCFFLFIVNTELNLLVLLFCDFAIVSEMCCSSTLFGK